MPDGRTHDNITLVTASFAAPICFGLLFDGNPGQAAVAVGSYLVSGLLFSDDLDTHSIEYKRWRLLRFLWLPYQKLMPHRSWLSHGLIIGPALRILYFAGMGTLALWLLLTALSRVIPLDAGGLVGGLLSAIARSIIDNPEWWGVAFLGFMMGSVTHVVSDTIWTWWRRLWRGPVVRPEGDWGVLTNQTHHGAPAPGFVRRITYHVAEE
jgi:uncharacterized metal-binding protein